MRLRSFVVLLILFCSVPDAHAQLRSRLRESQPTAPPTGGGGTLCTTPPCIWLDAPTRLLISTKTATTPYTAAIAAANTLVAGGAPTLTITAATNAVQAQFTIAEDVPWTSTAQIYIGRGKDLTGSGGGNWSMVDFYDPAITGPTVATKTGQHTFTIPVNTTGAGTFSGQVMGLFSRNYSGYDVNGDGVQWFGDLFNLGFAYQMTGTPAYCTTAVTYVHWVAGLGVAGLTAPIAIDMGYPARSVPKGLGLAYDWCFSFFAAQDKADYDTAVYLWYQWYLAHGFAVNGPASENYFGGFIVGFGLAGIASAGTTAHGQLIADAVRAKYNAIVEPAFGAGGEMQDGPIYEGYVYGGTHWGGMLQYLDAIKTATGEDIGSTSALPAALALNLIYSLKPNNWQFNDENDYAGDCTGIMDPNFPVQLVAPLAGHIEAQWIQYFYQHLVGDPFGGCTPPDAWQKMFWYNPLATATDYTGTLAPTWFARGNSKTHWRSAWNSGTAVWATMLGQTAFNSDLAHNNRLAGHIEVQRGSDFFLVNTNQYRDTNGVAGMPSFFNHGATQGGTSTYGNTLHHYDGGTYTFNGGGYEGGQGFWAPGGSQSIRHQEDAGQNWSYEKANLQPAYCMNDYCTGSTCPGAIPCHTLIDYGRSVFFEGSGIGVVYDRAVDRTTGYIDKDVWQIHKQATVSGPTGGVLTYTLGVSRMFLKPMLPCGAVPTLTQSENNYMSFDFTHRLEVIDPAPTVNYRMVTVFAVAASGASAPTIAAICSTGNTMYGASVVDGAITYINLFSATGADLTTVTYAATCASTGRHMVADLTPLTQFSVTQGGTVIATRVSSSQGVISFDSPNCTGTFVVAPTTEVLSTPTVIPIRYAGFTAPNDGETVSSVGGLRIVADGFDVNFAGVSSGPPGTCLTQHGANHLDIYANDTKILTLPRSTTCEFSTFKGRPAAALAVGTYSVWARAVMEDGTYLDSPVRHITVDSPTCGTTVTLMTDLDVSGTAYVHSGSAGNYYCINGNGHSITGTPTSFLLDYVFAYNLGATTTANGVDITTSGNVSITHSRFENNAVFALVVNSTGTETISDTVFASNSKAMLGQNPDQTDAVNGHGSYPFLYTAGSSNGAKVFKANQVGAGFMDVRSSGWTIGGTTAADGNVMQGPRVGIHLQTNAGQTGMLISRNYIHHIYYGGWSQGDLLESGNTAGVVIEHNVLVGSSWPVRYMAGIFRYNLLDAFGGVEGLMWTEGGTPDIHHNVFRAPSIVSRGMIYMHGATTNAAIRNNTFDMVDKNNIALDLTTGTGTILNSNLFVHSGAPVIGGTITANYNTFFDTVAGNVYNPTQTPANDSTANPTVTGFTSTIPWNLGQAWTRTKTVNQILADTRTAYTPTTGVIDNGDTATYGANNDRGAIGAGGANANDQF